MKVRVKRLSSRARIPSYAHPGEDACFDLKVLIDDENEPFRYKGGKKVPVDYSDRFRDADSGISGMWIRPGDSVVFSTGLAFEVPSGHVMKIYARSSTGIKNSLMLSNGTGIIDSGYRGAIHIGLHNFGEESACILDGDRVAQAEICEIIPVEMEECEDLSDTSRGISGIGSSGRK